MSFKALLKKSKIFFILNARIKCWQLKHSRYKLSTRYNKIAKYKKFIYSESDSISAFKNRISNKFFLPKPKGQLRIFLVGTDPNQEHSGFIQALNKFGYVSEFKKREEYVNMISSFNYFQAKINIPKIIAKIDNELKLQFDQEIELGGVDLVVGQMQSNYISVDILNYISSKGAVIINISMDDRLPGLWGTKNGRRLGSIGLASSLDLVLTTAPETCSWYGVEGCPSLFFPLASCPTIFANKDYENRNIDVLFIGNKYGVREKIISGLEKRGINVQAFGLGWKNGPVDVNRMSLLSKKAKIIVGIGSIGHCENTYTLKLRDFDAPMSGALYITHRNPDLNNFFIEGEDIEFYETIDELATKIKFYLEHDFKREKIAKSGQEKVIKYHNWDRRLSETFTKIGLINN
jgi:spore maturation protein CgeB